MAWECAKRGDSLFICGRNRERLEAVAEKCRGLTDVRADVLDVADEEAVRCWIESCDARRPIDIVFANAGIGTGVEDEQNVRRTFAVNVGGSVNTVLSAIAVFRPYA